MTNKDRENKIRAYVVRYKRCLAICMNDPYCNNGEQPLLFDPKYENRHLYLKSQQSNNENAKYLARVNFSLSCLERRKAMLLWKEFFFQVEKFWWMRYYTRSTFYRLRKKAIEEFLCLME